MSAAPVRNRVTLIRDGAVRNSPRSPKPRTKRERVPHRSANDDDDDDDDFATKPSSMHALCFASWRVIFVGRMLPFVSMSIFRALGIDEDEDDDDDG
jgi:hypothetical protein